MASNDQDDTGHLDECDENSESQAISRPSAVDVASGKNAMHDSWVSVGRYLPSDKATEMVKVLERGGVPTRVSLEGRVSAELNRVRVSARQLDDAESILFEAVARWAPATPDRARYTGLVGTIRRRKELRQLEADLDKVLAGNLEDELIELLWKMVAICPEDDTNRLRLVDALLERGKEGDAHLARWWGETVMRRLGSRTVAIEMANIAMAESSWSEAEAWLDEAEESGAEPAAVAFERCNLAFSLGRLRELKQRASEFRRACDIPDWNWVEVAALLAAAGEIDRAGQMMGTALRDSPILSEDEWGLVAALKMVVEGVDDQSRRELIDLVGSDAAEEFEEEALDWFKGLKRDWNVALTKSRKAGKARHMRRGGDSRQGGGASRPQIVDST